MLPDLAIDREEGSGSEKEEMTYTGVRNPISPATRGMSPLEDDHPRSFALRCRELG